MKRNAIIFITLLVSIANFAQINTDRVILIGRNALYYEDYVLSIQYFNQVIKIKPYLAEPYYYRAIAKFYLDDVKGAEEDCSLCVDHNPFYINAYQLRGDARLSLEDYKGAIEDYKKVIDYSPDNKYALRNQAIAHIQNKDYKQAENDLDVLLKAYPKFSEALLIRGTMHAEVGDTAKAFQDYGLAIEYDKYYSQAYSMRGLLYYQKKDYDDALADFDEAIKLEPLFTGNYINRGLVKYSKNDLRGAMADYDKVIETDPNNIIARFNRGLLRRQVGDDNRAIEDFDIVIKVEPENYLAYLNRALLKQSISDNKGAIADLDVVLAAHPDFYQGFYIRSELKRKQNNLRSAESDYLYARKAEDQFMRTAQDADDKASAGKKGKKEKDSNIREQSDNTIDKFNMLVVADTKEQEKSKYKSETRGRVQNRQVKIELEPRYVVTFYEKQDELRSFVRLNKALDNLNSEKFLSRKAIITNREVPLDETQIEVHFASINEYSKLVVENPNNPNYLFARAMDYMLIQDFASASEDLTKAIELKPDFMLAYFNLGVVYTKQLIFREHVPEYESSAQEDKLKLSENIGKSSSLGSITLKDEPKSDKKMFEYENILKSYAKVLELDPDFVYAYYNRGEVRSMQRDFRAAILDYNEALKREPEFADAYFNRGLARLQIGDKTRGLSDLRKAGELGIASAYSIIKRMTE
ncbi:tetratricopeptide repeat protein [Dysgonomonas sp. 216]|uniref:tetratricopeptide repeat protein n=1 Tax=Dysgonomonas sp. 216 TaxID=2302934 RepID=UPI0013D695D3|nr:tetratricopeptide repeat protein [Dysgonomonas sp. 216]NDW18389.1 tetratricopeptide repeat protein [Dysgonomonas sp. 216]